MESQKDEPMPVVEPINEQPESNRTVIPSVKLPNGHVLPVIVGDGLAQHEKDVAVAQFSFLPPLSMPKFRGDITEFESFWTLFATTIDKNPFLSNTLRLYYLRECLHGEPLRMVRNLPLVDSIYEVACDLLQKIFADKNKLVLELYRRLDNLPMADDDRVSLQNTYLKVEGILKRMQQLEQKEYSDEYLRFVVAQKYPSSVLSSVLPAQTVPLTQMRQLMGNHFFGCEPVSGDGDGDSGDNAFEESATPTTTTKQPQPPPVVAASSTTTSLLPRLSGSDFAKSKSSKRTWSDINELNDDYGGDGDDNMDADGDGDDDQHHLHHNRKPKHMVRRMAVATAANNGTNAGATTKKKAAVPAAAAAALSTTTLMTTTTTFSRMNNAAAIAAEPPPWDCVYCGGRHWCDQCEMFPSYLMRKAALGNRHCYKCLRPMHDRGVVCGRIRNCLYCGQNMHHRSLCPKMYPHLPNSNKKSNNNKNNNNNNHQQDIMTKPSSLYNQNTAINHNNYNNAANRNNYNNKQNFTHPNNQNNSHCNNNQNNAHYNNHNNNYNNVNHNKYINHHHMNNNNNSNNNNNNSCNNHHYNNHNNHNTHNNLNYPKNLNNNRFQPFLNRQQKQHQQKKQLQQQQQQPLQQKQQQQPRQQKQQYQQKQPLPHQHQYHHLQQQQQHPASSSVAKIAPAKVPAAISKEPSASLFPTVCVDIRNALTGETTSVRLLFTSGMNLLAMDAASRIGLHNSPSSEKTVSLRNGRGTPLGFASENAYPIQVTLPDGSFVDFSVQLVSEIVKDVPSGDVTAFREQYPEFAHLTVAETGLGRPVELLLGFTEKLQFWGKGDVEKVNADLYLMDTSFGWLLCGKQTTPFDGPDYDSFSVFAVDELDEGDLSGAEEQQLQ